MEIKKNLNKTKKENENNGFIKNGRRSTKYKE